CRRVIHCLPRSKTVAFHDFVGICYARSGCIDNIKHFGHVVRLWEGYAFRGKSGPRVCQYLVEVNTELLVVQYVVRSFREYEPAIVISRGEVIKPKRCDAVRVRDENGTSWLGGETF